MGVCWIHVLFTQIPHAVPSVASGGHQHLERSRFLKQFSDLANNPMLKVFRLKAVASLPMLLQS